jgi:sigma-B regulation protein RsbU (phosphoserine phosphatase)
MSGARPGRVLIVDDEPGMLRAAERVLAGSYAVLAASRPSEALRAAAEFEPDVAVCDIRMPEMDGFALAEALKAAHPGIDVIFMTGSSTEPDAALVRAIRSRAFYFIQKPFDREVLLTLVDRCMELRRLRQAERAHTARLERELSDARLVQRALLPEARAVVGAFDVAAELEACRELGGDFCDYEGTRAGGIAFIIADVCGHGASAALFTSLVKSAFHSAAGRDFAPRAVISLLARAVRLFGSGRFLTAIAGRIGGPGMALEYVNAGHPPAALAHDASGSVRPLESTGPLVSCDLEGATWDVAETEWGSGARLLMCTDGLGEALGCRPSDLSAFLVKNAARMRGAGEMVDATFEAARDALGGRPAPDDITLLAISGRE